MLSIGLALAAPALSRPWRWVVNRPTMARLLRGRYLCVVECRDMIDLELRTRMIMLTIHLDDQYDRFT